MNSTASLNDPETIAEMRRMCYWLACQFSQDNAADQDDLASVGFCAMLRWFPEFEGVGPLKTFLMSRARFAMIDELRRWRGRGSHRPVFVSIDAPTLEDDDYGALLDLIPDSADVVEECAQRDEVKFASQTAGSSEKWGAIVHLLNGDTLAEAGRKTGFVPSRIHQIKDEFVVTMRRKLAA